jgi:hypothetical protein
LAKQNGMMAAMPLLVSSQVFSLAQRQMDQTAK